jgi:hypothetical protein
MKTRILIGTFAAAGVALTIGQMTATALPGDGGTSEVLAGPDVIVGAIPDVSKYGSNTVNGVNIMAYAFGTTSCNVGSVNLRWWQNTSFHPVIPQNAYRIKNGRIEQIGIGWMKHGFCALQENLCSTCQPGGIGCGSATSELGVGCSDPYTAGLNGSQGGLGPRYEVNPSTGYFPATGSTQWPAIPSGQGTIGRRCQIKAIDLDPTQNTGAVYLAECMYVHPDDAANNNDNNNASYRLFTVGANSGGAYNLTLTGSTFQMKPAIYHWSVVVPGVTISSTDAPDGRYMVGSNVTQNEDGSYHYEYAVFNYNSDSAARSFYLALPQNVTVSNVGFKDVTYHSGEPFDGTDWTFSVAGGVAKWECTQTFAQNPNANALRWATMYNFWFDSNAGPTSAGVGMDLFKTSGAVFANAKVPANPCRRGDLDCNGVVNGADLGLMLAGWGTCGTPCPGDLDGNGVINGADIGFLLASWG